ncbi:MAG: RidA family protein [Anaerolineae bacterium]
MAERSGNEAKKEIISPAPQPGYPFSRVVGYGGLVFVSGTVGRDPATGKIAEDIGEQTRQVLENIEAQLAMAGTARDRVLKTTVFLVDMGSFEKMNRAYSGFFGQDPPARSCVEVRALPDREALIEVEVIAAR